MDHKWMEREKYDAHLEGRRVNIHSSDIPVQMF